MFRILQSVFVVALVASLALIGPSPAAADSGGGRVGSVDHRTSSVDFDIVGFRCELAVSSKRTRPNGTVVLTSVQRGVTESSIALMTGTLTVETTAVIRVDGRGRVSGRFRLEPDASTGAIRGTVRGSLAAPDGTRLESQGRGVDVLRGVSVTMTTTTPADGATEACSSDLTFAGKGTATYREQANPVGAVVVASTRSFGDTVTALTTALDANPNLNLARVIDHQAAAASRGLALPPTTELFFGNPAIGTPLMHASQTAGIDLPQKMLIWEDLFGVVRVGYNAPSYLQSRHDITGADAQLQTVGNALAGLAGVATGTTVKPVFDAGTVRPRAGLITVHTDRSAAEAFEAIVAALEAAPPVNVALRLEHDVNAQSVGLELRPTKLVIFGNPSLGTVLMQTDQSIALDLPQKILVYTDEDGRTVIAYNEPAYIARRHDVRGQSDVLEILSGALATFAAAGR